MTKLWPLALLVTGCIIAPSSGGSDDDVDQTQQDVDHWNQLSAELDGRRTEFLGKHVQELAAAGSTLYWLDTTNFDPRLMHYDGQTKLAYGFSIGTGNSYNYRASASVVVTAEPGSDTVIYRAYDATATKLAVSRTDRRNGTLRFAYDSMSFLPETCHTPVKPGRMERIFCPKFLSVEIHNYK